MATSNGHYEIVRLLINAGADVNHADEVGTLLRNAGMTSRGSDRPNS